MTTTRPSTRPDHSLTEPVAAILTQPVGEQAVAQRACLWDFPAEGADQGSPSTVVSTRGLTAPSSGAAAQPRAVELPPRAPPPQRRFGRAQIGGALHLLGR